MKSSSPLIVLAIGFLTVLFIQINCKHPDRTAASTPTTVKQADDGRIDDCLSLFDDSDEATVDSPFVVRGPVITLYLSPWGAPMTSQPEVVVPAAEFERFQRIYGAVDGRLSETMIIEEFAMHAHISRKLDSAGISVPIDEVRRTMAQIRDRFPDDESFSAFLDAAQASQDSMTVAVCRDLRIEAYLNNLVDEAEIRTAIKEISERFQFEMEAKDPDLDRTIFLALTEGLVRQTMLFSALDHQLLDPFASGATRPQFAYQTHDASLEVTPGWRERVVVEFPTYYNTDVVYDYVEDIDRRVWNIHSSGAPFPDHLRLVDDQFAHISSTSQLGARAIYLSPDGVLLESMPERYHAGFIRADKESSEISQPPFDLSHESALRGPGLWSKPLGTLAYRDLQYMVDNGPPDADELANRSFECTSRCSSWPGSPSTLRVEMHDSWQDLSAWMWQPTESEVGRTAYMEHCSSCHGNSPPKMKGDSKKLIEYLFGDHRQQVHDYYFELHEEELAALLNHALSPAGRFESTIDPKDILSTSCPQDLAPKQQMRRDVDHEEYVENFQECDSAIFADVQQRASTVTEEILELGEETYMLQCAVCHGEEGRGDGPAGLATSPPATDFTNLDAWQNSPSPTGIYSSLQEGMPGTAMPSYRHLSDEVLWAASHFVAAMAPPTTDERSSTEMKTELCRQKTAWESLVYDPCKKYGVER